MKKGFYNISALFQSHVGRSKQVNSLYSILRLIRRTHKTVTQHGVIKTDQRKKIWNYDLITVSDLKVSVNRINNVPFFEIDNCIW